MGRCAIGAVPVGIEPRYIKQYYGGLDYVPEIPGFWFRTPHQLILVDERVVRIAGPTLVWKRSEPNADHRSGRFVRATWLIHDMSVWRIDIIYPDAPGGPWIATEDLMSGTKPAKPTWHRATDPVKLLKLLGELELLSGEFYGGPSLDGGYTAQESTPEPAPAADPPAQAQASTTTNVFTGWRWLIPGVLLGAAVAVVAVHLFPRRRWELID
ncbi:hypothetical protein [Kribbella sindirgiensis]|uniref:hypothetical protein n=1 Tax=Kribbella sindirgiensis TaxID=1124744 RepID=UPI00192D5CCC|nr:hypothetical protein [Kribbella sindirgiensis]